MQKWVLQHLSPQAKDIPYSFVYGGRQSADLLSRWKWSQTAKRLDGNRIQNTVTRADPESGLQVKCVSIAYRDYPAVEWTVTISNVGTLDTPIVENLRAIDTDIQRQAGAEFLLHHNVGSPASRSDYGPLETSLGPGATKRISAAGGRPTNSDMSYFNLAWGNQGTIVVVGWPGQWEAEFKRDADRDLHVDAGQELTHFKLHPGEEVRTPLMVLLDYKGDWIDGQNQWRRWMMSYGMPRPFGKLPKPSFMASSSRAYGEMIGANEANQIMHIDRYLEEGLKIDYWWMDAGWYVQQRGWPQVGTWEVDPKRFPNGFKPISDHAHKNGVKTLVWFEPERVAPGTWLAENHPEWMVDPFAKLITKRSSALNSNEPLVVFNTGADKVEWNGIAWEAKGISLHPGPKGEYSVIRWTCPKAGNYAVNGEFKAIDGQATTDVHILTAKNSAFDGFINVNGKGSHAPFSIHVQLAAGDYLDFALGYGNASYAYDSTGLSGEIIGDDGVPHDPAREFGSTGWTYGWLSPGAKPNPATFRAYDVTEHGGEGHDRLLNLGNVEARTWLTNHIDKLLTDNGIDLYRQDFNIDPLSAWQGADAPDREGITENKYIVGYLAYWDELRRRHPNMVIDSCASGGRRNDLETMRRAVPLWRSDYAYESIGHQCMTYGISMWLPFHGTGTVATTDAPYYGRGVTPVQPYAFWSNAAPSLGSGIDIREKNIDYAALRRLFGDWREVSSNYYGDYYPLTPYSQDDAKWIAWQFNNPKQGSGLIQAFRRQKSGDATMTLKLRGLDPKASYTLKLVDAPDCKPLAAHPWTGIQLMSDGLPVTLNSRSEAAILTYRRLGGRN